MSASISLACQCGRKMRVPESALGKAGKCPSCQAKLRLIAPGFRPGTDVFEDRLIVEEGPDQLGQQFLIGGPGPIEIGKLADRHIALNGAKVSRVHCQLIRSAHGWRIEDRKSTNGTFVNNTRIAISELNEGDRLTVGDYHMRFSSEAVGPETPPPLPSVAVARVDAVGENSEGGLLDNLYGLAEGDSVDIQEPSGPISDGRLPPPPAQTGGPTCPSCQQSLAVNARICVHCGIDLKTGRAILTAHDNIDEVYMRAEAVIRWISWLFFWGIYPIGSEAFGTRKPYVVYGLAILTVITSFCYWAYEVGDAKAHHAARSYELWGGRPDAQPEILLAYYTELDEGDLDAFQHKFVELARKEAGRNKKGIAPASRAPLDDDQEFQAILENGDDAQIKRLTLAAHEALPAEQRATGQFHGYQLVTNAFLHAGMVHLFGNLLFLMVLGTRVNALLGNVATILLYPILAVIASLAHLVSVANQPPIAALGASGAVMGLAGLYIVLMPLYKMHMAAWWRWGFYWGFRLSLKLFSVRGFWAVLFYIAFDVLATVRDARDGTAHWAHLGGFIGGAVIGLVLLFTRCVNARGGDILSGLLGQTAWVLVGKPGSDRKAPLDYLP